MWDIITLKGNDLKIAELALKMETELWTKKKGYDQPASVRRIGVLGELAALAYLRKERSQFTIVPNGINHRMGLAPECVKDRGDILLIGKSRKIKTKGPKAYDTVTKMEVKATANTNIRYTVEKHYVDSYLSDGVYRIILVWIDQSNQQSVECTIDDYEHPQDIADNWRLATIGDRTVYVSPRRRYVGDLKYAN